MKFRKVFIILSLFVFAFAMIYPTLPAKCQPLEEEEEDLQARPNPMESTTKGDQSKGNKGMLWNLKQQYQGDPNAAVSGNGAADTGAGKASFGDGREPGNPVMGGNGDGPGAKAMFGDGREPGNPVMGGNGDGPGGTGEKAMFGDGREPGNPVMIDDGPGPGGKIGNISDIGDHGKVMDDGEHGDGMVMDPGGSSAGQMGIDPGKNLNPGQLQLNPGDAGVGEIGR